MPRPTMCSAATSASCWHPHRFRFECDPAHSQVRAILVIEPSRSDAARTGVGRPRPCRYDYVPGCLGTRNIVVTAEHDADRVGVRKVSTNRLSHGVSCSIGGHVRRDVIFAPSRPCINKLNRIGSAGSQPAGFSARPIGSVARSKRADGCRSRAYDQAGRQSRPCAHRPARTSLERLGARPIED